MTEFSVETVAIAFSILAVAVVAAGSIRRYLGVLRRLFMPNAVVAGFVCLLLGPQVLGRFGDDGFTGVFPTEIIEVWSALPGLLINVVFASILLGKTLPSLKDVWHQSAPQVMFGATLSFGQYALGAALAVLVLVPVFDLSELSAGLLEISFTGGHGTAAGLSGVMNDLGFPEGPDLALGLATVGLLAGILLGTWLINRAVRSDDITIAREQEISHEEEFELSRVDLRDVPEEMQPDPATSPITVTFGAIALAIGLGWLFHQALIGIETLLFDRAGDETFMGDIPLFPFTIIGGAALQLRINARGWSHLISRDLVNQVSGLALDLLIAAAIATLSLSTIGDNAAPFLLMVVVALAWSVVAVVYIAPRVYGPRWFERAIGDFGQSSGTVASGFLLIDMSDPAAISGARETYGYKQLLFEPFLGGGLITALSLPIIDRIGATTMAIACAVLTLMSIGAGRRLRLKET